MEIPRSQVVMNPLTKDSPAPSNVPRKGIWRRRFAWFLVVFSIIGAIGYATYPFLLRSLVHGLERVDSLPEGDFALAIWDIPYSANTFDRLIDLVNPDHEVLIFRRKSTRPMKLGLEKLSGQLEVEQLQKRGHQKIHIIDGPESRYLYQFATNIKKWMAQNPGKPLVLAHGRMLGLGIARTLSRHLTKEDFQRIHFFPLDYPDFEFENWFRAKEGQGEFINKVSDLLFDLIFGDGQLPGPDWDEKAYEESLP